jgi:hypothetical protein
LSFSFTTLEAHLLKLLDVLIGVGTVMLVFSMAVTVVTHFVTSAIGSRGRNLLNGLTTLLQQLDPTLEEKIAKSIANTVLSQPMLVGRFGALGTVIHREELTMVLMQLAAGESPKALEGPAKTALVNLLQKNNISDPAGTLKNIRDVALQLEAADPALATDVRHAMAIVQEAKSAFVAKIHGWFDQTIDRVSQRFTLTAHGITFLAAVLIAFGTQLDTIALINRLSLDDSFRAAVVSQAQTILDKARATQQEAPAAKQTNVADNSAVKPSGSDPKPEQAQGAAQPAAQPSAEDTNIKLRDLLHDNGLISAPDPKSLKGLFSSSDKDPGQSSSDSTKFLGIMLSALLMSLGAPFWYSALQNILRLRSAVAQKDDQQRSSRQNTQDNPPANPAAATAVVPAILQGEQGDLSAVG